MIRLGTRTVFTAKRMLSKRRPLSRSTVQVHACVMYFRACGQIGGCTVDASGQTLTNKIATRDVIKKSSLFKRRELLSSIPSTLAFLCISPHHLLSVE